VIFAALLLTASVVVAAPKSERLQPIRMAGPAVKRWSGYLLVGVGIWFVLLATLPSPIIGS